MFYFENINHYICKNFQRGKRYFFPCTEHDTRSFLLALLMRRRVVQVELFSGAEMFVSCTTLKKRYHIRCYALLDIKFKRIYRNGTLIDQRKLGKHYHEHLEIMSISALVAFVSKIFFYHPACVPEPVNR